MITPPNKPRFSLVLSLLLLLITYGAEGWMYAPWINKFVEHESIITYYIQESARIIVLYGAAMVGIAFLVILFTSPVFLLTVGLNNLLKSDSRKFFSIFLGAFAFAIIVQRVDFFARFLVLVSAVFLGKLDLQLTGFNRSLCSLILLIICWFGFTGGILAFYGWNF